MTEQDSSLDLAATYFENPNALFQEMGWLALFLWAERQPEVAACWPDGSPKSQGTFTSHLTQPASSIRFPAIGAKGVQTRFQQDVSKAAIYDLRAAA